MATSTVENYLKTIFLAQTESGERAAVSTGSIASALGVAPGTATAMVKTLADSGLVSYEPYSGVTLTAAGGQLAAHVLRRHRLLELFLVRIMGMNWSEVHAEAEELEHAVSDRLLERIDEMLGHPSVDPHGDPIPDADGEMAETDHPSLLSCPTGRPLKIIRVTDQRREFLRMLEQHQLMPGMRASVRARDEFAQTVEIESASERNLQLGYRAAAMILVEPTAGRR